MAKSKKVDNLEVARNSAQTITVSLAVLMGVFWAVTSVFSLSGDNIDTLSSALFVATAVGGVVMGLLYLIKLLKDK